MAKGSRNGVARGKKGDSVYYRISGSNNNEKQGERQYVAQVRNPKTVSQSAQRIKMTPAVNFYRAFKEEILDHSFQGVTYGARCHATFMKAALTMASGYPFVILGRENVAPGEYLMSRGSIPSLSYYFDSANLGLRCPALFLEDGTDTLADWSKSVIERAPFINNGDQVTFAFVLGNEDGNEFPYVTRLVLDTTNETDMMSSIFEAMHLEFDEDRIDIDGTGFANYVIEGAAIIISRPVVSQTTGAVDWLRSTQKMVVNYGLDWLTFRFFSQSAYDTAMISLMGTSKSVSSTWYLNQGKTTTKVAAIPDAPVSIPFQMGVTAQVRDTDSWLYGVWLATLRDTNGKTYLIADPVTNNLVTAYGYAANGNTDVVSNTLYAVNTQSSTRYETDAAWVALKAEYDGVLTPDEASAIATANGVSLTFTTGA